MKRLLALCLSSCLCLPFVATAGVAVSMAVSPTVVLAQAEVLDGDSEVTEEVVLTDSGLDDVHHEADGHDTHSNHEKTPLLSFDFGAAFWNLLIFVSVLLVLSIFVWPNVLGGLQAREDRIREDLESAEKANTEAQAILAGYQGKLDEASTQVQKMLAEARADAEASGQKIVDQAKEEASAQRERAVADIENAKKVAMAEMASRTSDMAMQVARSVVGRELSADDHAELIRQAMERLPSQN
ncbi:F-type H+-transporting ATPase subunit b [Neorhodopirellula lusitana]|uniref:ATP synthase subunit b n=1 Tax=Neorhodopirellula lusitana TaxID=445327 RepID=A0ABY1QJL3_9BACT|nr:ATP synthase F0 subunit B [Neorhodopirellula lusitana]SMP71547.1 F-type H+-transporting ATPase subunit b [Neorhodopirellula lusitana]